MSTFSRWLLTLALAFCPLLSLSAEPGKDASGENRGPLVTGISPTKGKIGQYVTVRGKGLKKTTKVESQPVAYSGILNARFRVVSDEELRVMVTPNVGAVVLRTCKKITSPDLYWERSCSSSWDMFLVV